MEKKILEVCSLPLSLDDIARQIGLPHNVLSEKVHDLCRRGLLEQTAGYQNGHYVRLYRRKNTAPSPSSRLGLPWPDRWKPLHDILKKLGPVLKKYF